MSKDHGSGQTEVKTKIMWAGSCNPRQNRQCVFLVWQNRSLGRRSTLLHWSTAPDNLGERSLNIIQNRPSQKMGNWHMHSWLFTQYINHLNCFHLLTTCLRFIPNLGLTPRRYLTCWRIQKRRTRKATKTIVIFFVTFPLPSFSACAWVVQAQQ